MPRVPQGYSSVTIRVTQPDGTSEEFCVLLAASADERARGLMEVDSLGGYDGMVFRFGREIEGSFYMLKTRIPLSVAFFAQDGTFVSSTDMVPCPEDDDDPPCERYGADGPYADALEVAAGDLPRLGIGPGATLAVLDPGCRPSG
jgi:uncharacterized membrane protein (UPF0127 family)